MDPVTVRMVRAALVWLLAGVSLGALMMSDRLLPGSWRAWFSPTHGHILFVGWFLQFAVGIAFWLLPRKRSDEFPFGYRESVTMVAVVLLNGGLLLRVLAEPLSRAGGPPGTPLDISMAVSGLLQLAAIIIIVSQLWSRVIPRPPKRRPTTKATGPSESSTDF